MARFACTALLALTGLLSACGGGTPPSAENILRVGNGAEPQGLDPHTISGVPEHQLMIALYDGLLRLDPDTNAPIPAIAERWDVSDDGRTYTFYLRPDAQWSNGDPLTAEDFVFAWKRALTPKMASPYADMLLLLEGARAFHAGETDDFGTVGVHARDAHTLEVSLVHPTPYFLTLHVHYIWYPLHRASIEAAGDLFDRSGRWTRPENIVTNGPFVLTAWRPGEVIQVRRNPRYWNADAVTIDGVDFLPIENEQTEERSFRAGGLDLTNSVPSSRVAHYRAEQPDALKILPYFGTYYYRFNTTRKPFDDVRVRRALSMAINRDEIVNNVLQQTGERPADHFVPPAVPGYTPPETRLPYDPEAARALLAEAGYPGGQGFPSFEILYNTMEAHRTIAEAVQRMWRETLGIDARLLNQDWKVYMDNLEQLKYDVARAGWIGDFLDPITFLELGISDNGNNRTGYANPEYDALIEQARAAADAAERTRLFQQAESILMRDAPVVPFYFYTRKLLKSPRVRNFHMSPTGYVPWHTIQLAPEGA